MLDKIKKYKYIVIFLLLLLFCLCINKKVNAVTEVSFNYNNQFYNSILPKPEENEITKFVICYSSSGNIILSCTTSPNVNYAVFNSYRRYGENRMNITYENRATEYRYFSNDNGKTWSYVNAGYDGLISLGNNSFGGFLLSNIDIYKGYRTDGEIDFDYYSYDKNNIVHTNDYKFPLWHIEYYEPFQMYYAFTEWYDMREKPLTAFYAYGDHLSYSKDYHNIDDYWDWEGEVTEYKGTEGEDKFIMRTGFPLNVYSHYSYLQINLDDHSYCLDALDFTEETLKGSEYEGCLDPLTNLNLYLDERTGTPTVYSNYIPSELLEDYYFVLGEKDETYFFQISFDGGSTYNFINIDCKEEKEINGKKYTRFYYKLFANGTYTFKLTIYRNIGVDKDQFEKYEVIKTFDITSYEEIIDKNGNDTVSATPFITAYSDGDRLRFSTQTFYEKTKQHISNSDIETERYIAYYIDEESYNVFGDNYQSWILMDIVREGYDFSVKTSPYHFETDFPYEDINDGDKFYFVFYDEKLGCFSNVTTYVVESKTDIYMTSQNITFNNDKFQRLYDFFYNHFGFLMYPLEFVINLLNRVLNINYSEPILSIPTLYIPGTNNKIFNGYEFNFNSLLENKAVANIYNIYLVAVDFCIVIALVIHAKKVAEEVFTKNG